MNDNGVVGLEEAQEIIWNMRCTLENTLYLRKGNWWKRQRWLELQKKGAI